MAVRLAAALCSLALLAPSAAFAQGDSFGPLPPAAPEPTPQPTPPPGAATEDDDVSRELLFAVGGGLLLVFSVIAVVITRDARRSLPEGARGPERQRDEGPHRHERQAKAKARKKGRDQRKARRNARRRGR